MRARARARARALQTRRWSNIAMLLTLLRIGAVLQVHVLVHPVAAGSGFPAPACHVKIGAVPQRARTARPRNVGFLIGVGPGTPDDAIMQLSPHVPIRQSFNGQPISFPWKNPYLSLLSIQSFIREQVVRGPFASQPFWTQQAQRLGGLGVETLQLILGPQILETRWVAAQPGRNNSALRAACWPTLDATCPLPGSVADPQLEKWVTAISQTMDEVKQLGLADRVVYDIW